MPPGLLTPHDPATRLRIAAQVTAADTSVRQPNHTLVAAMSQG
jgi:hypothetical protein